MPIDELERRAEKVKAAAAELVAVTERELPGLVTLTGEQRAHAPRLREGEHAMLTCVLDVADLEPALFDSLRRTAHPLQGTATPLRGTLHPLRGTAHPLPRTIRSCWLAGAGVPPGVRMAEVE